MTAAQPIKCPAFSLVEMLMALLVASLLMAAMAPVMTKKFNEGSINISGVSNRSNGENPCTYEELVEGTCSIPAAAKIINVIVASGGGGGGAGVIGDEYESNTSIAGNTLNIDDTVRNVIIELKGAGGGGGGGNAANSTNDSGVPTSQEDCEPFGVYVSAEQNGGTAVCVSKFNPVYFSNPTDYNNSDKSAPNSNVSGVSNLTIGGISCSNSGWCCWRGQTAGTCQANDCAGFSNCTAVSGSDVNNQTYSACNRTVCQWNAADAICRAWMPTGVTAGRLPTRSELSRWSSYVRQDGDLQKYESYSNPGLQLCDASSGNGALQCASRSGCKGSAGNCHPYHLWSGTAISGTSDCYYRAYLNNGSFGATSSSNDTYTYARGVRCVIENLGTFTPYSGGGGGGGAYVKIAIPDEVIKAAAKRNDGSEGTGRLTLSGGTGGAKGAEGAIGGAGGYSIATITNASGTKIWEVQVPGGSGGQGAPSSATSETVINGGAGGNVAGCQYLNTVTGSQSGYATLKTINCGSIKGTANSCSGGKGSDGGSGTNTTLSGGGSAGAVNTSNNSCTTSGSGGSRGESSNDNSDVNENGGDASTAGTGGGGGNAKKADGTITKGKGGKGANGSYSGTYTKVTTCGGAGGGGGGAGALVKVKLEAYRYQGKTVKIENIADGGKAGTAAGVAAEPGQESVVQVGSLTIRVIGGRAGSNATKCVARNNPITAAIPGAAGAAGNVFSQTLSDLKNAHTSGDPVILLTETAAEPGGEITGAYTRALGGNGGLMKTVGGYSNYPCGAFATLPQVCADRTTLQEYPSALVGDPDRAPTSPQDAPPIWLIETYAFGTTGGGGGGWSNENTEDKKGKATDGAKGMPGYAYVWFEY